MRTSILFLIAIVLAAGCAHARRPLIKDVSPAERSQDEAGCRAQSTAIQQAPFEYRGTFMEGAAIKGEQQKVFSNCMLARGYRYE